MPQPIINDTLPLTQIVAGLNQLIFSTNWTANAAADVVVYNTPVGQPANDVADFVNPTQYTVAFIGQLQQVQVTFLSAPAQNNRITITRTTPVTRQNLYTNTNFTPSMLNQDFEIVTLEIQENDLVNQQRAPRYNYSELLTLPKDLILPILGANQFWAKDANNTSIVALDISAIIGGGTVTDVMTGTGLTGGPITTSGTISFAAIPANTFWANITGVSAVPTQVSTGYFLQTANNLSDVPNKATARTNLGLAIGTNVEAWSAKLDSLAGLSFVQNNLLYVTSSTTLGLIAAANNSTLITGNSGVPSLSQTLPQAVQTNIQYLGQQNQNLDMGGHQINNGADPTQPTDFATKNYVDLNSLTGTAVYAASAASLGTVTQSGAGFGATLTNAGAQATFALDGVNPPVNSKVLIKNTATGMTAANEGIYTVTNVGSGASNWVLTRATSYDTPTEINQTGLIIIQNGSTLAGTAWYNAATIVTVDTTNFSYSQFGNITFPVSLAHGGTNANLTAAAGGVVYSGSTALAISAVGSSGQLFQSAGTSAPGWTTATFPSTATGVGTILRADGTNWVTTTATYPATTTINQLLYSSANNTVTGLATATTAVLTTSSGVPTWANQLSLALGGTNAALTASNGGIFYSTASAGAILAGIVTANRVLVSGSNAAPSWTATPYIGAVIDANGHSVLEFDVGSASAVNYVAVGNAATGIQPSVAALGTDTNINLRVLGKGTGGVDINGRTNGVANTAGNVGEIISSTILSGSAISITNGGISDITHITLTPGNWLVSGNVRISASVQSITQCVAWQNTISATFPDPAFQVEFVSTNTFQFWGFPIPPQQYNVNANTNIYLSCNSNFSSGTANACGYIIAMRLP